MVLKKKADPDKVTLTLVVELDMDTETLEYIKELIEHSRGFGRPLKAVISGLPPEMQLTV